MVAVIDELTEAGAAPYIEFKVHRSPDDPDLVLGSWRFAHGERVIDQNKPGTSITMEFRFAVDCADQHGIPFVWVNDPEELFPPWVRR
ncbi:MAG: hypothetical protein JO007_14270 [Alphaproteobacteria bacterium]|nr:hypothetical protein [Alphaproteobacteria bacterium]